MGTTKELTIGLKFLFCHSPDMEAGDTDQNVCLDFPNYKMKEYLMKLLQKLNNTYLNYK